MSEHKLISAQEPDERDVWPMWEVQGYGTVTGAGDPRDGAARCEILPPWVDIRLTFADGARIDVLAVVRDGRIAIEDAQADPPVDLDGFAALAESIEGPLQSACQVVAGRIPPAPEPEPVLPATEARDGAARDGAAREEAAREEAARDGGTLVGGNPVGDPPTVEGTGSELIAIDPSFGEPVVIPPVGHPVVTQPVVTQPVVVQPVVFELNALDPAVQEVSEAAPADVPPPDLGDGGGQEREQSGRHRARPALPRGSAARRSVAEIYRAAQQEGHDPVLAVMSATGFSRRKSLRLIAGARDAGHLSPRHNRR